MDVAKTCSKLRDETFFDQLPTSGMHAAMRNMEHDISDPINIHYLR